MLSGSILLILLPSEGTHGIRRYSLLRRGKDTERMGSMDSMRFIERLRKMRASNLYLVMEEISSMKFSPR
jgi:hypothetical protein